MNLNFLELVSKHQSWARSKPSVRYSTKLQKWKAAGAELEPQVLTEMFKTLPWVTSIDCTRDIYGQLKEYKINDSRIEKYYRSSPAYIKKLDELKSWLVEKDLKFDEFMAILNVCEYVTLPQHLCLLTRSQFLPEE